MPKLDAIAMGHGTTPTPSRQIERVFRGRKKAKLQVSSHGAVAPTSGRRALASFGCLARRSIGTTVVCFTCAGLWALLPLPGAALAAPLARHVAGAPRRLALLHLAR